VRALRRPRVTSIIGDFGREAFATPPTRGRLVFMRITPEVLDSEFTLSTAATRLDFLSRRDNGSAELKTVHDQDDDWSSFKETETSLDVYEALELLALGEVISRRAHATSSSASGPPSAGAPAGSRSPERSGSPRRRHGTPSPPPSRRNSTATRRPPPGSWPAPDRPDPESGRSKAPVGVADGAGMRCTGRVGAASVASGSAPARRVGIPPAHRGRTP